MNANTIRSINALSAEAHEAGDLRQEMICALALGGPDALAGAEAGTDAADLIAEGMTMEQAQAECERIIAAAQE